MISRTNFLVLLGSIAFSSVIFVEVIRFLPVAGRVTGTLDATAFNLENVTVDDLNGFWKLAPNVKRVNDPIPGVDSPVWTFTTNSLGFRGEEFAAPGKRFRIMTIGDSTTFGLGVNDDETWPAVLQKRLNPEVVEVINLGIPGNTSLQGLCQLLTFGLKLKPDLVVVTFAYNDQYTPSSISDLEILLSQKDQALTSIRDLVEAMDESASQDPRYQRRLTEGEFLDAMIEINAACKRRDIDVLYLAWPHEYAVLNEDNPKDYRHQYPYLSTVTQSPVVDLRELFKQNTEKLYIDVIHANATGCRVVGEHLAKYLSERGLIPQPSSS